MRLLTAANRREFEVDQKYPSTYRKQPSARPRNQLEFGRHFSTSQKPCALIRAGFHLGRLTNCTR